MVTVIDEALARRITIRENGEAKRVTVYEAIMLKLWSLEVSGDQRALKVRLAYQEFARKHRLERPRTISVTGGLPRPALPDPSGEEQ